MYCCKFPTTALIIDDNAEFAKSISDFLIDEAVYSRCLSHSAIYNFLSNQNLYLNSTTELFWNNSASKTVSMDFQNLYHSIYSYKRFECISTIVLDFKMPTLNGIEIAERIHSRDINRIFLTGEMEPHNAINTFNAGTIDMFISKSSKDFKKQLLNGIKNFGQTFFESEKYKSLTSKDTILKDFVSDTVRKINSSEYYMYNKNGSYIFMNENGRLSGLYILTSQELSIVADCISIETSDARAVENIRNGKEIPVLFADEMNFVKMQYLMVPCQILEGILDTYYCAFVEDIKHFELKFDQIKTYKSFLSKHKLKRDLFLV